jgi:hypothetical protein
MSALQLLVGADGKGDTPHDFLEALLSLVGALALSAPGSQVLADAGVMQMLLTLLEDTRYVCHLHTQHQNSVRMLRNLNAMRAEQYC